jgi:hypothetical protein
MIPRLHNPQLYALPNKPQISYLILSTFQRTR